MSFGVSSFSATPFSSYREVINYGSIKNTSAQLNQILTSLCSASATKPFASNILLASSTNVSAGNQFTVNVQLNVTSNTFAIAKEKWEQELKTTEIWTDATPTTETWTPA
jgi:hypothetical protein|tara:strand:- start:256 stop:585 length:330 start_codon:yes stop_codon:yes gene_type:complete